MVQAAENRHTMGLSQQEASGTAMHKGTQGISRAPQIKHTAVREPLTVGRVGFWDPNPQLSQSPGPSLLLTLPRYVTSPEVLG